MHYNNEEDAKKFFRISNRFIKKAIQKGGKAFIHSSVIQLDERSFGAHGAHGSNCKKGLRFFYLLFEKKRY